MLGTEKLRLKILRILGSWTALLAAVGVTRPRMPLPIPFSRLPVALEPPALVRLVSREDVTWDRPVFKAPPLSVRPPLEDIAAFTSDFRQELRSA